MTVTVESERLKLSLEETGTIERPWSRGTILDMHVATGRGWVTGVQQHTHGPGTQVQLRKCCRQPFQTPILAESLTVS